MASKTSAEGFRGTQKAFGFLHDAEWYGLKALVAGLPPGATAVNIGAGAGTSGLILREGDKISKSWTVDIQGPGSPFGSLEGERNAFIEAKIPWDQNRHDQVCGDSKAVGKAWQNGPLDFVFIDGDHSYAGCAGDIEAWLPHIKVGGVVAIHDYAANPWPDVVAAVDALLRPVYPVVAHHDTVIAFRVTSLWRS